MSALQDFRLVLRPRQRRDFGELPKWPGHRLNLTPACEFAELWIRGKAHEFVTDEVRSTPADAPSHAYFSTLAQIAGDRVTVAETKRLKETYGGPRPLHVLPQTLWLALLWEFR